VLVDPSEAQRVHRLKAVYDQKVVPLITEEFGYTNVHQVLDPAPRRRKACHFSS
jgi:large subunit ribosomal protein L5